MYTCEITEKMVTLDDYERGEVLGSENWMYFSDEIRDESLPGLIAKIMEHFDVSHDDLDTCNGNGTICVSRQENADGEPPTKAEAEKFRRGKCRLWNATYWGVIHRTIDVSAAELNEALSNIA